jgi:hypothetical protein
VDIQPSKPILSLAAFDETRFSFAIVVVPSFINLATFCIVPLLVVHCKPFVALLHRRVRKVQLQEKDKDVNGEIK